jgi:murein tripeptide amidase MpaA
MPRSSTSALCLAALLFASDDSGAQQSKPAGLLTLAESSGYEATSLHAEVLEFCRLLADRSPKVRLTELGVSREGRTLPLMVLADPPVSSAEEARRSGKLVVFAMGNIHAGEVDGKEALLMLARDLVDDLPPGSARVPVGSNGTTAIPRADGSALGQLIVVFAPIFNADGNERISVEHRKSQAGPVKGVGIRENADGFDLNRDFVKLETPEVRSLVRFFNEWDPHVVVDCHTTNGSFHRYTITYEGGRCPAGDPSVIEFTRSRFLPDVDRRFESSTGYHSFFYGNFSPDHTRWETILPTPRYGTHYVGLRNRVAVLCESYSYAPFRDRVLGSYAFVHSVLRAASECSAELLSVVSEADRRSEGGAAPPDNPLTVQFEEAADGRTSILGYVETTEGGRRRSTGEPKEYAVDFYGGTRPTAVVERPRGYLIPASLDSVAEKLREHGIQVMPLDEETAADVEVYRIRSVKRSSPFQRHELVSLECDVRAERRTLPAGTLFIPIRQRLADLAGYLLQPQSEDGLAAWNFLDEQLTEGDDFPVLRLRSQVQSEQPRSDR